MSELTGAGQGEGEKTCPLGNQQTPSFSPCHKQHRHSKQHGPILAALAGVRTAFMWLLVLHRGTLSPASESFYDSRHEANLLSFTALWFLVSYCSVGLSLDAELSTESTILLNPPTGLEIPMKTSKVWRPFLMRITPKNSLEALLCLIAESGSTTD